MGIVRWWRLREAGFLGGVAESRFSTFKRALRVPAQSRRLDHCREGLVDGRLRP